MKIDKYKIKNENKLYVVTKKELKNLSPFDFENNTSIYIVSEKIKRIKYLIYLIKKKYSTYRFESIVVNTITYELLTTSRGKKEFKPYYIDDFLKKTYK